MTLASVATMIGAGSTVAIVSEVYNTGISYGISFPLAIIIGSAILAIISKRIKKAADEYEAYTLVDFFEKRFDNKNKILAFFIQIFITLVALGSQAIAMASLASVLIGTNYTFALILAAAVTIGYTTLGGLKVDYITDFIQFWIILIVFVLTWFFVNPKVGGLSNLIDSVPKSHLDPFAFAGPLWLVAVVFLSGLLYLGFSGTWQRIASAKSQNTARNSFILAMPIFIILSLLFLFFGLSAKVLLGEINPDVALFSLLENALPAPLLGVGFAAILAVLMSTIDSEVIAGSTIIYRQFFKKDQFENKKEIFYARLITALFGVVGFSIAFLIPKLITLSLFSSYMSVTFALTLLFALYSDKISSNAAFWALSLSILSLLISYPIIGPNSFIFPVVISIPILIFYDKIFKKKSLP